VIAWIPPPSKIETINPDMWNEIINNLDLSRLQKPNVARGKTKQGKTQSYLCFGFRKDPLSSFVGRYIFVKGTDANLQNKLNNDIEKLVRKLEVISSQFFQDTTIMEKFQNLRKLWNVPTIVTDGVCTQFSIGYNYWSPMHVDHDYFYTTITCCCRDVICKKTVIYNFCFPEYGITIPMFNGSVFVFDPSIMHCCSNPLIPNAYIMSCYVSQKTVNSQIAHASNQACVNELRTNELLLSTEESGVIMTCVNLKTGEMLPIKIYEV
jgi:hypothetical protein